MFCVYPESISMPHKAAGLEQIIPNSSIVPSRIKKKLLTIASSIQGLQNHLCWVEGVSCVRRTLLGLFPNKQILVELVLLGREILLCFTPVLC